MDLSSIKSFYFFLESRFHSFTALVLGELALFILLIPIDNEAVDNLIYDPYIRLSIYVFIFILFFLVWAVHRWRLPRNKKKKLGIVIAIWIDNDIKKQKYLDDFILKIEQNLISQSLHKITNLILLKDHLSRQVKSVDDIRRINKKIKGHFYLWGSLKKRNDGESNESKYFFHLNGYVAHAPVNIPTSNKIKHEFSAALPNEISFWEKVDLRGFKISADCIYLVMKYVIGMAALVSGDFKLAKTLHQNLDSEITQINSQINHRGFVLIQNSLLSFISYENFLYAWDEYYNKNNVLEAKKYLKKSLEQNENNYGAWLFKSILDFSEDKNISEAFKSIRKAKNCQTHTQEWRYNEAFLYFWTQKYQKALSACRKINSISYDGELNTLTQVRKFNLSILSSIDHKPQLFFWIGFLSYFKEHNLGNAIDDFENFMRLSNNERTLETLRNKTLSYLTKIRQEIGY